LWTLSLAGNEHNDEGRSTTQAERPARPRAQPQRSYFTAASRPGA
jgi:hypothetical protein